MTLDDLKTLFASPRLIDIILLFTAVEVVALPLMTHLSPTAIARALLPGVFLLLALRAALANAAWPWVPAALAAALIAHLWDLKGRWRL